MRRSTHSGTSQRGRLALLVALALGSVPAAAQPAPQKPPPSAPAKPPPAPAKPPPAPAKPPPAPAKPPPSAPAKPPGEAPKGDKDKPKEKDKGKEPQKAEFAAEVMILHATNSGKGIDERIGNMPELKKPPFSSYDSYALLSKTRLPLVKDDPKTTRLPNGRVLQTKLLEVLPNKETLRISASINQPRGKTFLPLLEVKAKVGQAFIVAGQSYKNGILVLVIRVVK
jgi:hypothetical protein